jgi:hypothetical protein
MTACIIEVDDAVVPEAHCREADPRFMCPVSSIGCRNAQIQADLAELQAALAPPDPATLRARGNARFTAGDAEGAAEAFTLLLNLPGAGVPGAWSAAQVDVMRCGTWGCG